MSQKIKGTGILDVAGREFVKQEIPIAMKDPEPVIQPEPVKVETVPEPEEEPINEKTITQRYSYIEDWEVKEAEALIERTLGFPPPRAVGLHMWVKVYIRDEECETFVGRNGKKTIIAIPKMISEKDRFTSVTGLVLRQGPLCYQDKIFKENWFMRKVWRKLFGRWMELPIRQPWCRVGDFVAFPRHEGQQLNYRGVSMHYIRDDAISCPIADPRWVRRD